jgi:rare lipoprotein A
MRVLAAETGAARVCAALALALAVLVLASCSRTVERPAAWPADGAPSNVPRDLASIPDAVPRVEPRSRYGNPSSYEVLGRRYEVMESARGHVERGIASWYGTKFHGRRTSSGEPYDMYAMTAAHKSLPLPTYVSVTNLGNSRRVVLKVNDRGPFHSNRVIDLSYAAAAKLDILRDGTGLVEVRAIDPGASLDPVPVTTHAPVGLYLQVGAFAARGNAERLLTALEPITAASVRVSTTVSDGRTFYRVRLGPLESVGAADVLAGRLRTLGLDSPSVILD